MLGVELRLQDCAEASIGSGSAFVAWVPQGLVGAKVACGGVSVGESGEIGRRQVLEGSLLEQATEPDLYPESLVPSGS